MVRIWLALLAFLTLGGCATAGPLALTCRNFESFRQALPDSTLEQTIHGGFGSRAAPPAADDPLQRALEAQIAAAGAPQLLDRPAAQPAILLLSGGGQWGAFGAGFLGALDRQGALPHYSTITGVSTGALQALFIAVAGTDTPPPAGRNREAIARLLAAYAPASEKEVVDRHSTVLAVVTGSIAGLKPLRRRIEQALCANLAEACMIDRLASIDPSERVLIGFVEAASGNFYYADALRIARELPKADARNCLTGIAMASAAMPVFFQQVRINGKTYYDGGVRQSVFEARIAAAAGRAVAAEAARRPAAFNAAAPLLPIYVIRNGPTRIPPPVDPNKGPDTEADALSNAQRAEAIIVNQLEIGSLAALRLEHPTAPIHLVTADGWGPPPTGAGCFKPDKVMFDPAFMACLTRYGTQKGEAGAWIELPPLAVEMQRRSGGATYDRR